MTKADKEIKIMPPSAQRQVDQNPERKGHRRKDTKRWCKGVKGREHQLEIVLGRWVMASLASPRKCGQDTWLRCVHQEQCAACGKIMAYFLPWDRCPDNPNREEND